MENHEMSRYCISIMYVTKHVQLFASIRIDELDHLALFSALWYSRRSSQISNCFCLFHWYVNIVYELTSNKTSTTNSVSLSSTRWHRISYFQRRDLQSNQGRWESGFTLCIVSVNIVQLGSMTRTVVPHLAYDLHRWMWSSRYNQLCLAELDEITRIRCIQHWY
jgi:hypothetical protein